MNIIFHYFISLVQDKHIHFMIHKILPYPITKCWHEYSHEQVRCKVFSHKRRFCRHVRLKSIEYQHFWLTELLSVVVVNGATNKLRIGNQRIPAFRYGLKLESWSARESIKDLEQQRTRQFFDIDLDLDLDRLFSYSSYSFATRRQDRILLLLLRIFFFSFFNAKSKKGLDSTAITTA